MPSLPPNARLAERKPIRRPLTRLVGTFRPPHLDGETATVEIVIMCRLKDTREADRQMDEKFDFDSDEAGWESYLVGELEIFIRVITSP